MIIIVVQGKIFYGEQTQIMARQSIKTRRVRGRRSVARTLAKRSAFRASRYNQLRVAPPRRFMSIAGQPTKKLVRMTYSGVVALAPTAGAVATHVFSANGIFDPDITGTGTQPLGHDQWSGFYNHYCVIASKMSVTFDASHAAADTANPPHVLTAQVMLNDDATQTYAPRLNREQNWVKSRFLNTLNNPKGSIVSKFNNKRLGIGHPLSDDRVKSTFGANPTEQAFYIVTVEDLSNTTVAIGTVYAHFKIDYIVALLEPKDLTRS